MRSWLRHITYVTFGGEQVQSGSFLDIGAPNGLFALGKEKISVPSILSREDLMADSLPMSFGHDGIRRINFGDKGSSDQEETPFNAESTTVNARLIILQWFKFE
ncbi:aspartyl protease family protein 1-like [Tripterygium wilfordii]|uniref:aspartyl protease family protein 1-like n=1 Tax=Tripterygium wilfordii TaxID=458696 RepID=UPI0018F841BF|nr:aspartyl protease family protein 1-like [Tripterygium wilfordii]